jgi:diguanylate cyclase (GGDEF)-like protein
MPEPTSLTPRVLALADHDPETGLWNRRHFEEELDRSRENNERLALLSIDVDAYRDVIHRHGASRGETLIRSIAHVLAKRLQPNTTLARMGGDEFAAVLHGVTPQDALSRAEDLCTAVRVQTAATGSARLPATISIGVAVFNAGTQTHHEALLAADTALYEAKAAGCDRAILHQSSQGS